MNITKDMINQLYNEAIENSTTKLSKIEFFAYYNNARGFKK